MRDDLAEGDAGVQAARADRLWVPAMTTTAFSHNPRDIGYLSEPGGPLDPARGWLIQVEQLGNGRSTSPSNARPPFAGPDFPKVSIRDNVALQANLLDHLKVRRVRAIVGGSMGGQQALQWAVSHPDGVEKVVALVGNARTTLFAQIFLNAVALALKSDPAFEGGRYGVPPLLGLSRMAEVVGGLRHLAALLLLGAASAPARHGRHDARGFLAKWRPRYHEKDANDLLCQLDAWMRHDICGTPECRGRFDTAAARATMPILLMPGSTDLYFDPQDVLDQAGSFPNARIEIIESLAGHAAAFGREARTAPRSRRRSAASSKDERAPRPVPNGAAH